MTLSPQREGATVPHDDPLDTDLLDIKEVCEFFGGLHPSTIYRGIKRGWYPAPIAVGPNTSRWLRSEIEAALSRMIAGRAGR